MLVRCKNCGCWIETDFGNESPENHTDATGTYDDPRSPADWDDICDVCGYKKI
jgi:hypothetical protein